MRDLFNKTFSEPVQQAIKEGLRLALIAFASYVVSFGINYVTGMPETQTTIVLTFFLRSFDKWLHEYGKTKGDDSKLIGGLTRF